MSNPYAPPSTEIGVAAPDEEAALVERAEKEVKIPAALLLIGSSFAFLATGAFFVAFLATRAADDPLAMDIIGVTLAVVALTNVWVGYAMIRASTAKRWAVARSGAILGCIPIFGVAPITVPAGIWLIVVLRPPHVKRAFRVAAALSVK